MYLEIALDLEFQNRTCSVQPKLKLQRVTMRCASGGEISLCGAAIHHPT